MRRRVIQVSYAMRYKERSIMYERKRKGTGERGIAHQSQSAVPAHAVPEDTDAIRVHLFEVVEDGPGQFRVDVAVHLIPSVPWGFGRVDIESRAAAKIVGVILALDI